ncbi:MAG: hypothetical protein HKN74_13655 [Acidimicrobiia bacterium]|nr:hypothetical protein [Acidimicrobiia bacterium]MBT8217815.1 hypothetical protein [Acidimicrobiia bacterium]NNF11321.1 hypothetical protein [Acidimicrobiia bacterium]NNL70709.1 hypothetical protein [Acidimicrobiia bacterium]
MVDRLSDVLAAAARGEFPPVDGVIEVTGPPAGLDLEAVVEFTGHAIVATALPSEVVLSRQYDAFGGIVSADALRWLAGPSGEVGCLDVVLVTSGTGRSTLPLRGDLDEHPRVIAARRRRNDVIVYGDDTGLVTVGIGLGNRWEVSVELFDETARSGGAGRRLIGEAIGHVPDGEPVFASVAPGNAASLRSFLATGFEPIGAEVIIHPGR